MAKIDLSVVICTLGFTSIYKTLDSLIKNKGNWNIEILIVGNLIENRLEKYPSFIKYYPIKFPHGDLSNKRNFGFKKAKSDIIAFIDDDVEILDGWINSGLNNLKNNKQLGVLSGPGIVPKKDASFMMKLFGNTLASIGAGPTRQRYRRTGKFEYDSIGDKIIGCNMMIRKSVYKKIGGFDVDMIPAEELDFAFRAIKSNFLVARDPNFYLIHYARSNIQKFFKQIFRFGKSRVLAMQSGSQPFRPHFLTPAIAFILFILLVLSSFIFPIGKVLSIYSIGVYATFIFFCTLVSVIEDKVFKNFLLLLTLPLMHLAYAVGEIFGLAKYLKSR